MTTAKPIFSDPTQRRWRKARRILFYVSGAGTILFVILVVSVILNPVVSRLQIAFPHRPFLKGIIRRKRPDTRASRRKFEMTSAALFRNQKGPMPALTPGDAPKAKLSGFYVNSDYASLAALRTHAASIQSLYPQWLFLEDADGNVELREDGRVMGLAEEYPDMKIIPLVINFDVKKGRWMKSEINAALNREPARRRLMAGLIKSTHDEKYHGVMIDFEDISDQSRASYIQFLRGLAQALHNDKKTLSVCVEYDRPESIDYRAVGEVADHVILMAYDQHAETTEAGPICSIPWFTRVLEQRLKEIPPAKAVIAIGNYGYDWAGKSVHPRSLGFNEALQLASESKASVDVDPESLNPNFEYTDAKNVDHEVWFLDAVTAFNEMQIAFSRGVQSFALWRLGIEDNGFWGLEDLGNRSAVTQNLSVVSPGERLEYEGTGEMISVETEADNGHRRLTWDARGPLIVNSEVDDFPNPYMLARYGFAKKKVAFTFDDGPDPEYTPQILDILKHYGVRASFFCIGLNAQDERNLVRREFAEGHEVGNHTFTHPNIAEVPKRQLELELNATQRLMETILKRNCLLFRPPFNTDAEPATQEEAATISVVTRLGYITVGSSNDPEDYLRPGVDHIVKSALSELDSGNIILLHDGGGPRDQTVAALPLLINQIRGRGYEIVSLSELLGKTRDDVMPPLTRDQRYLSLANVLSFGAAQFITRGSRWGLIVGVALGLTQFLCYSVMAAIQRSRTAELLAPYRRRIDVIVPAYNEEKVAAFTIRSLLQSEGVDLNIIVVDDGSTDGTLAVVRREFGAHPRVRILAQTNQGKAAALNAGIRLSDAEIVVTLDSDTIFSRRCLQELVGPFCDPKVTAVAGNAKVGNRINILTRWQALEYITTQNFIRRSNSLINCITVVPGAVGAWRREMLLRIGGYVGDTLAEDGELTIRVLKAGGTIVYADAAVAWTEAPQNLTSLFRQRFRWMFGTFQTAWKHRKLTFDSRYGSLGWIAMPNTFVFQVFFPFTAPLMDLAMFLSLLFFMAQRAYHPADFAVDEFKHTVFFYSLFLLLDFATAAISIVMEREDEDWSLLVWLPWQRLFYRQLNHVIAIRSMFTAMKGKAVGWGHITRNASHVEHMVESGLSEPRDIKVLGAEMP